MCVEEAGNPLQLESEPAPRDLTGVVFVGGAILRSFRAIAMRGAGSSRTFAPPAFAPPLLRSLPPPRVFPRHFPTRALCCVHGQPRFCLCRGSDVQTCAHFCTIFLGVLPLQSYFRCGDTISWLRWCTALSPTEFESWLCCFFVLHVHASLILQSSCITYWCCVTIPHFFLFATWT